jgi:hypothetical protein
MSRYGLSLSGSEVLPCGESPQPSQCSRPVSSTSCWNLCWPVRLCTPGLARRFFARQARSLHIARCQLTIPASSVCRRAAAPLQDLSILRDLCALPDYIRKSLPSRVARSAFAPRRLAIMNYHSATDQRSGSACFPLGSVALSIAEGYQNPEANQTPKVYEDSEVYENPQVYENQT